MFKGEFSIIGIAAATCLIWILKLSPSDGSLARPNSPPPDASTATPDPCGETPCITFLGNLRVGDNFLQKQDDMTLRKKKKDYFFKSLNPLLDTSAVIGNLDTPLTKKPPSYKSNKSHIFWAERNTADILKKTNITAVSLANRHIYDFGDPGLDETTGALKNAGIPFFGIKRTDKSNETADDTPEVPTEIDPEFQTPTIFKQQFSKSDATFDLAVFSGMYHPPTKKKKDRWEISEINIEDLCRRISDTKDISPHVFVVAYLGFANIRGPASKKQQQDARAIIDAGADLVVGYGSRFLQEVERYKHKWIVYGLGDTVSTADLPLPSRNQRWPFSGALRLILEPHGNRLEPILKLYPLLNNSAKTGFQPRLLDKKSFGDLFWYLLRKERIEYDFFLKKKIGIGRDTTGRYVSLAGGEQ